MVRRIFDSSLGRPVTASVSGRKATWGPFVSLLVCALFAAGLVLASVNATDRETRICPTVEAPTHPFTDVTRDSFAFDDVTCIYLLGVTTGTSPTTYSPQDYVTREQMAAFMGRLYGAVTGLDGPIVETPFTDLPTTSYAYEHLGRIYGLGITTGTSATTYLPYNYVTREEIASFMARFYRAISGTDAPIVETPFTDVPTDSFAYGDVARIYGLGLTTGTSTTTYSPERHMTREEMAAFLARYYRLLPSPSELEILRRNALLSTTTQAPATTQAPPTKQAPTTTQAPNGGGNGGDNGNNGGDNGNNGGNNGNNGGNQLPPTTQPPTITQPPTTTLPSLNNPATCTLSSISSHAIAFVRRFSHNEGTLQVSTIGEIWVANEDGTNLCRLTYTDGNSEHPAWSPNGAYLAYTSAGLNGSESQVWVVNADGSNARQITSAPLAEPWLFNFNPTWSPDSTKLAFRGYADGTADLDLHIIDADGTDQRRVSSTYHKAAEPSWSPDGTKIAFTKYGDSNCRDGIPISGDAEIWVMNVSDGVATQLTGRDSSTEPACVNKQPQTYSTVFHATHPEWSPDGTKIAYTGGRGGSDTAVWVMDADGTNETRLTSVPGYSRQPSWSHDGTQIAYSTYAGTEFGSEIWIINADGTNPQRITHHLDEVIDGYLTYIHDREPFWR